MINLSITQIDSDTGILCTSEPMRTGPSYPNIKGCNILWCNKSIWPIATTLDGAHSLAPLFYGTCDDDADTSVVGVVAIHTTEEFSSLKTLEHQARKPYSSWIGKEKTMTWEAPISMPNDGNMYLWDESTISWKEMGKT